MFTPLTRPLEKGEAPWKWNVESVFQCTWFVFYRCLSVSYNEPCYFDRETRTGSYTNAKDWLANYREPWEVKGIDYTPVAGDIVVYDGTYGHVQFMETDTMYSEYANGNPDSFRNGKLSDYNGKILGYLHYPYESLKPVERNTNINQIETLNESLRIRTKPSLKGDIVGYVQKGYYNVLDIKEADGYKWYKLDSNRWCANIDVKYLPKDDDDIIRELEEYFNSMKEKVNVLTNENTDLKKDMKKIKEISEVWL